MLKRLLTQQRQQCVRNFATSFNHTDFMNLKEPYQQSRHALTNYDLEKRLASFVEHESASIYRSDQLRFILSQLKKNNNIMQKTVVISDSEAMLHSSPGIRHKENNTTEYYNYQHGNTCHLEQLIIQQQEQNNNEQICIVVYTHTLFYNTSTVAKLDDIVRLKERYNNLITVFDESYALGVCGQSGRGLSTAMCPADILVSDFGYGLPGSTGLGFIACSDHDFTSIIRDSTDNIVKNDNALTNSSLYIITGHRGDYLRNRLMAITDYFRIRLREIDIHFIESNLHVVAIPLNDTMYSALTFIHRCAAANCIVTVTTDFAGKQPILRVSFRADQTYDDIDELIECLLVNKHFFL